MNPYGSPAMFAAIPTPAIGASVRPMILNKGCSPCEMPDPFWSGDMRAWGCGFGLDTRKHPQLCGKSQCSCGCAGVCRFKGREIDSMFEDIRLSTTLAPAFGDDLISNTVIESNKGSYLHSLRCGYAPISAQNPDEIFGGINQSSWNAASARAFRRLTTH